MCYTREEHVHISLGIMYVNESRDEEMGNDADALLTPTNESYFPAKLQAASLKWGSLDQGENLPSVRAVTAGRVLCTPGTHCD